MKSVFTYLFLFGLCLACEPDRVPQTTPRIKPLVGDWKLVEIQITDGRTKTWQPVPYHAENDIEFLPNGVILDYKKEAVCCHPKELVVNGSIELVNAYIRYPNQTNCTITCVQCQVWTVTHIEGEMIITGCLETDVKKYRR